VSDGLDHLVEALAVQRQIELPRFLRSVSGTEELSAELAHVLGALGATCPLLVSGSSQSVAVCNDLRTPGATRTTVEDNTRSEVTRTAALAAECTADAIVAVGGGRPVDVAKAAALTAALPVIVIPTQLSTDGIASPIAVIAESSTDVVSERSALPVAVIADLSTICAAPIAFARAGVGDLLSNRTALVDWQLAEEAGKETVDDFAALLASSAQLLIEGSSLDELARGTLGEDLARRLLDGLVLSGLAMEIAGSSRPCSGSEHLISHSLDALEPGTASHGEQVAFGTLVATALQGGDVDAVRQRLTSAGLTAALTGFGLPPARLAEVVAYAPATRPGRYTVLDQDRPATNQLSKLIAELIA
jgi:glycerol-1-phosphate dehydrogenase [NAD(P)+]